jgi:hypothetical protein
MERDQLVQFVLALSASSPAIAHQIHDALPRPTLAVVSSVLQKLEKRLLESFPYTRGGCDTSDYSYNRVKPVLFEIKDTCLHYIDLFTNPAHYTRETYHEYPGFALGYLHLATSFIHRLPTWDSELHNVETRQHAYTRLALAWRQVIGEVARRMQEEGKLYGLAQVSEWAASIEEHAAQTQGQFGFADVFRQFNDQFGWLIQR